MGIGPQPPQPPVREQHQTVIVSEADAEAPPIPGIFQPSFQLTREDFMILRSVSRFWSSLGGVLCTFSVAYSLPRVSDLMRAGTTIEATDWWIIGVLLALGLGCFGVTRILSSERRALEKRIKQFFKDNPGQPEYRPGTR
jgi:hypothetical protein